ncbi:MAG TPA: hypothetical protein VD994_16235 [Prosthecobacter sp.]|nr:hypothetical protein [Prosthecobacter sp.]
MNGLAQAQLHFDFLTGRPTAIQGDLVTDFGRTACTSINRQRARGIKEATRPAPPGEPIPVDGWNALVARKARARIVPLIPLSKLGLSFDADGFPITTRLKRLASGAEATAWADLESRTVYKLFDLRKYALGKKLVLEVDEENNVRAVPKDANLDDTLEKLWAPRSRGLPD